MAEQLALGLSLSGDGAAPARLRSRSQPLFAQGFARRIELRRAGGEWIAVGDAVTRQQAPSLSTSPGASGRASCRQRVCKYGQHTVVAVPIKQKKSQHTQT